MKADKTPIMLGGDWVISVIRQQYESLCGQRSDLVAAVTGKRRACSPNGSGEEVAVDLSGVESMDASGCQLLVGFLKSLERDALVPKLRTVPDPLKQLLQRVGYFDQLEEMIHGDGE